MCVCVWACECVCECSLGVTLIIDEENLLGLFRKKKDFSVSPYLCIATHPNCENHHHNQHVVDLFAFLHFAGIHFLLICKFG